MNINEANQFLLTLQHPSVKSKHFTIDSLTDIAYLKRKLIKEVSEYQDTLETLQTKVKKSADGLNYVPIDDSPEAIKDHKDFIKAHIDLLKKDIEGLKLNFVTKEEMKKVVEDTSMDSAIILIDFLMKKE